MTVYYQDDLVTLYHADCREVTEWLAADVLATDPPYGRVWRQGRLKNLNRRHNPENHHGGIQGDSSTELRDWILAAWGDRPAILFGDLMLPPPAGLRQVLVYRKPPDAGVRGATAGRRRDIEAIYLTGPWPSGLGGVSSVIETGARVQGSSHGAAARYGHPHAKPLDVAEGLIGMCPEGRLLADPCTGSGTLLVASKLLGRRAIGVEIEERYCERAARRLAQDSLFEGWEAS
jgi:hypothetical protein